MDKKNQQRRPSRPVSELITLFNHEKADKPKRGQWQSEISLNTTKSPKMTHKRITSSSIPPGNSECSKSYEDVASCNDDKNRVKDRATKSTEKPKLKLALKPTKMHEKSMETPTRKAIGIKGKDKDRIIDPPASLKKEIKKKDVPQRKVSSGSESESCSRQKFPLDDSLAVLRREMVRKNYLNFVIKNNLSLWFIIG